MAITHISSLSDLDASLSKAKDKLSVIDFHATWCGPCHAIAPVYEALSKQYTGVNFMKCDVDAAKEVASHYSISAMPTFVFLKGKTKVDQVRGANKTALESALRRHSGPSSSGVFVGKGQTLGAGPASIDKTDISNTLNQATGAVSNLHPPLKILLGLVAVYFLFWSLS
ncbi:Peptide-N(4)-(N-acetyl-beta-glucosaminyl)asparagine amidase [Termitomyces sp. T112]|nr:Peptide-N(4)-(N-acetyl-beta-glucosaminyl)asparagine amidase [Termitomyces sp. T112]KAH0591061.1 hypothetical protein H2248_001168 [Termitomyces sp. 'cryptogamus']KNZ80683.1 Peptide-N(4)-(N-acetyl-beta-glucosaminyl)asparagine amidase [Termitomyces sp. J132]